jgi:hypothetical protein
MDELGFPLDADDPLLTGLSDAWAGGRHYGAGARCTR